MGDRGQSLIKDEQVQDVQHTFPVISMVDGRKMTNLNHVARPFDFALSSAFRPFKAWERCAGLDSTVLTRFDT